MDLARTVMRLALGSRLPTIDGTIALPALGDEVVIRRDDYGVPYIRAQHERDAWFGLGFCHAQDRAGQLELLVRGVRGTLAALVGRDALPIDRLSRRVGFRRAGDAQLGVAEPHVAEQIAAYVRGINAGYAHGGPKSHELTLLRSEPSRWESGDVQGYCVLLCFALASNWDVELLRLKILEGDGPDALTALDVPYPDDRPLSSPPGMAAGANRAVDRLSAELESFGTVFGYGGGSNAWAVAPSKTKSGRAILANDPHLMPTAPQLIYLANIRCPEFEVAGATWVGVPGFAPGHNGFAAWGATAAHADNTDVFLEQIGDDGCSVREADGFQRCEVRDEVIEIRGERPVVERVLVTPRGPIISPALDAPPLPANGSPAPTPAHAISLAGTWLARRPYAGLLVAHTADSFEAFRACFEQGSTSTINAVYADTAGHIGWHVAVEVPKRKSGHGLLPLPAWRPNVGWHDEPYRCSELPFLLDPDSGFVCTANNQPTEHRDDEPYLGIDWLDGYRQAAISEALASRDDWCNASTSALQRDTRSLPWRELRERVLSIEPADADATLARALLRQWDGDVSARSVGASVFELFMAELCCSVIRHRAPITADWALGKAFTQLIPTTTIIARRLSQLVRLIRQQPAGYLPSWPKALSDALSNAVRTLRQRHGNDSSNWRWGEVRPLTMVHAFAEQAPFDRVFNIGPLLGEGDTSTISQGGVHYSAPTSGQASAAVLRSVLDIGNWEDCRFAIAGGQSGNPLSPHYEDQLAPWRSGEGIPIAWSESAIAARTSRTLKLVPQG